MAALVALTGATGFIGSALLNAFVDAGTPVRALSRHTRTDNKLTKWIAGDLHSPLALQKLVDGADTIIHCAGVVRGKSIEDFLSINAEGTANLLNACKAQTHHQRFLLISSLAARQSELSWYALSKYKAEQTLNAHPESVSCTVFRPTTVYGPGDKEIRPMLQALKSGLLPVPNINSRFSLLHVNDLVSATLKWTNLPSLLNGVYELDDGTANGYNWDTLVELANQIWGQSVLKIPIPVAILKVFANTNLKMARIFYYSPMLTPGKVREILHPDWTCDNTASTGDLDWRPAIQLADAMQNPSLLQL